MPGQSYTLITGNAQATGEVVGLPAQPALLKGRLSAAGGAATINVYGYVGKDDNAPTLLATFDLTGANDRAEWLIDSEPWTHLRADIANASGGAVATCVVGY